MDGAYQSAHDSFVSLHAVNVSNSSSSKGGVKCMILIVQMLYSVKRIRKHQLLCSVQYRTF